MRGIVAALAATAVFATPADAHKLAVGDMAPDVQLVLTDKTKVKLSELRGQVVVLNFWATWCGPCRSELPLLDAYYRVQSKHGLRVFAVATEDSVPEHFLKPLFARLAIQPVHRVSGPYDAMGALPTNYIIDRSGHVRYMKAGAFTLDTLNEELVPLLKEPAPAS